MAWKTSTAALIAGSLLATGCGLFSSDPVEPPPPPVEEPQAEEPRAERPRPRPVDTIRVRRDTARAERPPERTEETREEEAEEREEERRREEVEERTPRVEAPPARRRTPPRPPRPVPVLPGAVLPRERIVAFYGHAGSTRMGILGELPPEEMLARLDEEVRKWERADPATPVRPALHVIATMATGDPGPDDTWRLRMPSTLIERVIDWAETRDALVFLDIQPGLSDVEDELPRLAKWLRLPNVHLALDPEWNMPAGGVPGKQIGTMRAEEVNVAVDFLARLVTEYALPPKVLVVHRFTSHMLPDPEDIETDPRVQVVVNMDGWGPPAQKLRTYNDIVAPGITQWAGFKLFFKNDLRGGGRLLTPEEILMLTPVPMYIQYQ